MYNVYCYVMYVHDGITPLAITQRNACDARNTRNARKLAQRMVCAVLRDPQQEAGADEVGVGNKRRRVIKGCFIFHSSFIFSLMNTSMSQVRK